MVDTMIKLFPSESIEFSTNGLGSLPDATSCVVIEERNGKFELEMTYPITGRKYEELELRRIIVVKSNPYAEPQPFRIYALTKPINGIVTVNAEHISYDLSGYPVSPFSADTIENAFINMKSACVVECPFSFWTDKTTSSEMHVLTPYSMRALLGGVQGSILDIYGGEYEFDGFLVKLHNHRGNEKENSEMVTIRYGKNLTDLQQEENCSAVYTGVYPYWYSEQEDGGLVQLDEKIVNAEGDYGFIRICPLDLSQVWTEKPTQDQIREEAKRYMKENKIGIPKVSLTVSFIQLAQSEEYLDYALLETVHLCDTVCVEFPELKVSATAKCISTTYNVLTGKYDKIELGDTKSNLASTVAEQSQAIAKTPNRTFMEQAIENATKLISGGLGGYVIIHSSTDEDHPDEILIMDTDDIRTATKVWRWNKGGLGYSKKGYNGPYETAITQDGQIVADFIAAGTMSANRINGGTLILGGENNTNGTCLIKDTNGNILIRLDKNGITLSDSVKISYENLSNTPNITQITKDTITTSYINALDIIAKEVKCVNGSRTARVTSGTSSYLWDGKRIGNIGTNQWQGHPECRGLDFDMDYDGSYMFWGAKDTPNATAYIGKLVYSRNGEESDAYEKDSLNIGASVLDMHHHVLKNVNWPEGGCTHDLTFLPVYEVGDDGTVLSWSTQPACMKFVNGILTDITWN